MGQIMIEGRLALHPAEVLVKLGYSRDLAAAMRTARNLISLGKYPLPLQDVLGKQRVLASDVFEALNGPMANVSSANKSHLTVSEPEDADNIKRRRGRPKKIRSLGGVDHA